MDKVILGINLNHADSSACIIINGKLIAAVEEERFNRIKHWAGFPEKSISFCLQEAGVDFSMIDDVAINTNPLSNVSHKIFYFLKNYITGKKKLEIFKRYKNKFNLKKN